MQSLYNTIRRRLRSVQPVRIEYAGTIVQGRHFEVADFQSVEARHLIMMLGSGSQSCFRRGGKDDQRCQQSGGEAYRISFENVSHRLCGNVHRFVYAFHWYVSLLLSFNLALVLHFGSAQAARNVFRFSISARCGDFHCFVCAFHLSFDIAFLNGRVELSHMLQLLACHSYSILSCCAAAVSWAGTRRFSSRSCMRMQSSNVSEASALQMNSCSQCSEQKTFGYRDVDLCGPWLPRQRRHHPGVARPSVMPSSITAAPADFPA